MDHHQQPGTSSVLSIPPAAGRKAPRDRITAEDVPLLLKEVNHRIRNLLAMVEAVLNQTQSGSVEDYRAKVTARISGLGEFSEVICRLDAGKIGLAEVLEQTLRPHCASGTHVIAGGPEIGLGPRLALWLHLVVHELATNATKYGALSSTGGTVNIAWELQQAGGMRKLALAWCEAGGPEVKQPQRRGFGSRLITRALKEYGDVQLNFNPSGVACYLLIDLDRDVGLDV
jgi:two-component sensor histidine kinase